MILNTDSMKPIYVQIAEWLELEILNSNIKEDERIYSQYQLADMFTVNPATAAKGLNLLADENIVYKRRGLGMFVSPNAKQFILTKRRKQILEQMIKELVIEANRLDVSESELIMMIHNFGQDDKEEEQL
ncbi:GntR family transcriptional regulator [Desulfosporosinus nitroreducens]|uniref:GntR family transcriptional regulator n=1 Tax=Desulfosporosinus nitroreducens TaxID=2018668 RepID=A0ABT8QK27_9FIRM|nr:GntR family transcriptional regulator [Desulfosporosinus nitroreducens]MCO1601174.1 GntR family transcriptional regulator [Desulfosporosinus nitroreducens]MDO0821678.1 GntR family transcriptional regulator [Desulfosporosinus nitroreducens]